VKCPASFILLPRRIEDQGGVDPAQVLPGLAKYLEGMDALLAKAQDATWGTAKSSFMAQAFDTYYLYLVDEVTGQPVTGPNYPIVIRKTSDRLQQLLPVLKLGLRTIKVANGVAGLAQCFFPGVVPKLPADTMQGLQASFDKISTNSSELLSQEEQTQLRGASLREFQTLLDEHDPQRSFCGLSQKVMVEDGGVVLWTRLQSSEAVERALRRSVQVKNGKLGVFTHWLVSEPGPLDPGMAGDVAIRFLDYGWSDPQDVVSEYTSMGGDRDDRFKDLLKLDEQLKITQGGIRVKILSKVKSQSGAAAAEEPSILPAAAPVALEAVLVEDGSKKKKSWLMRRIFS